MPTIYKKSVETKATGAYSQAVISKYKSHGDGWCRCYRGTVSAVRRVTGVV